MQCLSTGCPQGSVLSPVLFSLFTNEFCINECNMKLIKYADDMALVSLPQNADPSDDTCFLTHVKALEEWCSRSKLEINVTKTKEVTFSLNQELPTVPLSLDGQTVETVETFKYLGTVLDGQLKFNGNTDYVFKKCSQRLNLLRRLSSLGVSQKILELVYITHVESVLTFHLCLVWVFKL